MFHLRSLYGGTDGAGPERTDRKWIVVESIERETHMRNLSDDESQSHISNY